ncbi:MAG TPA: serine protease [Microcoleaceae cyanobacterium]|jgi:S1-C subfamily serine protease
MPKIRLGKRQFWLLGIVLTLLVGVTLKTRTEMQPPTQVRDVASRTADREHHQALATDRDQRSLIQDLIYQNVSPAVVTIYTTQAVGSGCIVRSDGLVLTNRHVVQNSPEVQVKTASGDQFTGKVIDLDLQYDLALVQLSGSSLQLPTVMLAATSQLKFGEPVWAIGSPAGKSGVLTTGTFTRITQQGSLQTSAGLLSEGNSGGPLLNRQGEVIGINKGVLTDHSGLATKVEAARAFIQRNDVIYKRQSPTIPSL